MRPTLLPHVHATPVDDDLVLLDVEADAYLCLPGAGDAWRAGSTSQDQQHDELWALLAEHRLAGAAEVELAPRAPVQLPGREIDEAEVATIPWRDHLNLFLALVDVWVDYRPRPFADILRCARRDGPARGTAADPELQRLCRSFHRLVVWVPISGKCLERSFLLLRFLQRSGRDAQWVFGVRTWPFRAHCWLQLDDVVLDDVPERLSAYTPILAA